MSEKKKKKLEDKITDGLRKLLRPKATWRSDKQAESMRSIIALKADQTAINVLPTGAGKSILFILPAVIENTGTSIVVMPFVILMDDLVIRAIDIGVDYIRYISSMSSGREGMPRAARLIVVSADIISSAEFCGYVNGLLCTGLLQRIFVDECHTVIMDIGYRAKLGELVGLRRFGCPLVLLTATLPVSTAHSNAARCAGGLVPQRDAGKVGNYSTGSDGQAKLPLRGSAGQARA
jgi:superfamily II DNA helicase RecQ